MDALRRELRHAFRALRNTPGYSLLLILILALGIGANTAIFSVVNGVLLRPLPFAEPDRLVRVYETFPYSGGQGRGSVSVPNFLDWREQNRSFSGLAAYSGVDLNLQGVQEPERLTGVAATADLFSLLGSRPLLGRTFLPEEDAPGAPGVAVVSEPFWRRQLAADPDVLGRVLTLDGEAHTVVGVMPAGFRFPAGRSTTDVWIPLRFRPEDADTRGSHWMAVVGRLRPGTDLAAAQVDMSAIARRIAAEFPEEQEGRDVELVPLSETVVGNVRPTLLVLLGAAGLVLLIVCANAANLLLARAAGRRREVAIRLTLGASRGRIVGQFLAEALLLGLAGAALGVLIAVGGIRVLLTLAESALPRSADVGFDARVLLFLVAVTVLTSVAFGLAPAAQSRGDRLHDDLKEGSGKTSLGRRGQRVRSALVVAQVSLSLVLLVGAGLLIRTLSRLLEADTGMRTENVLTLSVSLSPTEYPEGAAVDRFLRPVKERVESLPGVRSAAWIQLVPLQSWGWNGNFGIVGRPEPEDRGQAPFAEFRHVSPGYFSTLGVPVLRGRDLGPRDDAESPRVVVINRALAERYFPGEDPIGRQLILADTSTIVGVVGDIRQSTLDREPLPELYVPYTYYAPENMSLLVSTGLDPIGLSDEIRRVIREIDPDQPVYGLQTMERVVADSVSDRRLYLWLLGTFAGIALLLAVAGIYGLISYGVAMRSREIGIRMALGAESGRVMRQVVGEGGQLALVGLLVGVPAAYLLTRLLEGVLYGVSSADPLTYAAVMLLLAAVAVAASYVPARRATRVDPMSALRSE